MHALENLKENGFDFNYTHKTYNGVHVFRFPDFIREAASDNTSEFADSMLVINGYKANLSFGYKVKDTGFHADHPSGNWFVPYPHATFISHNVTDADALEKVMGFLQERLADRALTMNDYAAYVSNLPAAPTSFWNGFKAIIGGAKP